MANTDILIHRVSPEKRKVIPSDPQTLGFGRHFTDHMFVSEYDPVNGWAMRRIEPYRMLQIDPAMTSLHYGQMVFEGLKAYRGADDGIYIFRWKKNAERLQASCRRLMMEAPPVELFGEALKQLVQIDHDWVPSAPGCSLYLRPFVIATDPFLGVRPSTTYAFVIIASPVGAYYKEGFNPTRILVSDEDVRAVRGGLGEAKTAANYAASLRGFVRATKLGYSQVLWLDAIERRYIEEVGTSNVFFKIGDEIVTPPLQGTILHGVTRDSTIRILRHWGLTVVERRITIDEMMEAVANGSLTEAFGTGTAAVISPVGTFHYKDRDIVVGGGQVGELTRKLYTYLTSLQAGREEDIFGWVERVDLDPGYDQAVLPLSELSNVALAQMAHA